MTTEHDPVETTLVMQAAADSLRQLRESGSAGGRFVKSGGDIFYVVVRFERKDAVDRPRLSRERLTECCSKINADEHCRNLLYAATQEIIRLQKLWCNQLGIDPTGNAIAFAMEAELKEMRLTL